MNNNQFERWLRKEFGIVSSAKRGAGHRMLRNPANGKNRKFQCMVDANSWDRFEKQNSQGSRSQIALFPSVEE
jgi:hypothetical protein